MPVYNTLQFIVEKAPSTDQGAATIRLRNQLEAAGFTAYEGTPGSVRYASLLTPPGYVIWAVVDEITAPDGQTALLDLNTRLARAGFRAYTNTGPLVPDGYELAFLSENQ